VSDAGSTDGSEAAARALAPADSGMSLVYLRSPVRLGPGENRNRGAGPARGRIIGFIDDDCRYAEGALARALAHFDQGCDILRPRVVIPNKEDISLFSHQPAFKDFSRSSYGGVFFVRREVFEACRGFSSAFYTQAGSVHLGEDSDFLFRCFEAGRRDRFDPEVVVSHPVYPGDWRRPFFDAARVRVSLPFNRRWRAVFPKYGMNTRRLFGLVLNRESARIALSFAFVFTVLLAAALLPLAPEPAAAAGLGAAAAYALLAASYLGLVRRIRPSELALFSLELPLLAASYCFNFCWGLLLARRIRE